MGKVVLNQVSKSYTDGLKAVDTASFEVADAQLLVLLGPSGCGKSTILRMIAGLESISSGEISIDDRVVNDVEPKDRDIAMVFQSYALYPHMSVAENLAFGLKLRGQSRGEIARQVRTAADMLGLETMLERRPAALSGGQRQRVALGRALVRQPRVFLLDEPLSNLDAKLRMTMRVEIARLQRQLGVTMIYVTHDQVEAMTLGHRIVVMDQGRIQQIDAPMTIYDHPVNLFVASFLGSPGMNLLRGQLQRHEGIRLATPQGPLALPGVNLDDGPLAAYMGKDIVVGLRPEALQLAANGSTGVVLEATLEVIEQVGSEAYLNLRRGDQTLVARVPPHNLPEPGATVHLICQPQRMHFFAADSGLRIGQQRQGKSS